MLGKAGTASDSTGEQMRGNFPGKPAQQSCAATRLGLAYFPSSPLFGPLGSKRQAQRSGLAYFECKAA